MVQEFDEFSGLFKPLLNLLFLKFNEIAIIRFLSEFKYLAVIVYPILPVSLQF